jgi:osmotically-inducible protein OsmY
MGAFMIDKNKTSLLSDKTSKDKKYIDDTTIAAKIKSLFVADPAIKSLGIHVTTNYGTVLLTGTVPSQDSLDKIKGIVNVVKGVKKVNANLQIAE